MPSLRSAARLTLAAGLALSGLSCAINTEPIAAGPPSLSETAAPDAGRAGGEGGWGADSGAPPADPPSCDRDLTCTADCPEDLDCEGAEGPPEAPEVFGAAPDLRAGIDLAAGADHWLEVAAQPGLAGIIAQGEAEAPPPVILVLYAGAPWEVVARSPAAPAPAAVTLPADGGPWLLRVRALEAVTGLALAPLP